MRFIGSPKQLAAHMRHTASKEIERASRETTRKETRFHEGKARGLIEAAEMLEVLEVNDVPELVWQL